MGRTDQAGRKAEYRPPNDRAGSRDAGAGARTRTPAAGVPASGHMLDCSLRPEQEGRGRAGAGASSRGVTNQANTCPPRFITLKPQRTASRALQPFQRLCQGRAADPSRSDTETRKQAGGQLRASPPQSEPVPVTRTGTTRCKNPTPVPGSVPAQRPCLLESHMPPAQRLWASSRVCSNLSPWLLRVW